MKFPYGLCDFEKIITEGYWYQDRTGRIPQLEDTGSHLIFLRPRRFGKTLLLAMLDNYYDVAKAAQFEQLFGQLAIGRNPTPKHNQYFVMNWDFSAVSPQGTPNEIRCALNNHINGCIELFATRYHDLLPQTIHFDKEDALRSFQSALAAVQRTPHKLYLLVDEYDNFANEVIMGGQSGDHARYAELLYGEGALKTVFKAVKAATRMGLDRTFITGVSPIVLSDLTSGFNIAENITLYPNLQDVCGFQEPEIAALLDRLVAEGGWPAARTHEALAMMRAFYNGYGFSTRPAQRLYNPTLALYFLKTLQRTQSYPEQMLDDNLAMDRGKIRYVSQLPGGMPVILGAVNDRPPVSASGLATGFGAEEMLNITQDQTFLISLLYYFGVLTMTNQRTEMGELILRIPNIVIRKLYVERMRDLLQPEHFLKDDARHAASDFYRSGNVQPVCDFIEQRYFRVFDNRDYRWANELTLKTAFLTLLFNDIFYIMDSETPLGRQYADLTMIVRPDMRPYALLDFLLEFKYVSLTEAGVTGEQARQMDAAALRALASVQAALSDARASLTRYRQAVLTAFDMPLRLRVYAVISVGFDRLLWDEVAE